MITPAIVRSDQFKNFVKNMPKDLLLLSRDAISKRQGEAGSPEVLEEIKTALDAEIRKRIGDNFKTWVNKHLWDGKKQGEIRMH